jgi:hypothetical protein
MGAKRVKWAQTSDGAADTRYCLLYKTNKQTKKQKTKKTKKTKKIKTMPWRTKDQTHREILAKFVSFRDEKNYPSDTQCSYNNNFLLSHLPNWRDGCSWRCVELPIPMKTQTLPTGTCLPSNFTRRLFHTSCLTTNSLHGIWGRIPPVTRSSSNHSKVSHSSVRFPQIGKKRPTKLKKNGSILVVFSNFFLEKSNFAWIPNESCGLVRNTTMASGAEDLGHKPIFGNDTLHVVGS